MNNRLIKSNDAGGGGCTNTVNLYNPFPDGGGVALYQLNGDATDVSGNYDGVVTGTLTYETGVFGQAANFSSNDAAITANTFISSSTDTQDFSISMWFKHDGFTTPAFKSLIGAASASQGVIRILIRYVSANTYTIEFARGYNSTYYSYELTPSITLLNSSWYNLVVTYNSSLKKVEYYLNGSLLSYASIASTSTGISLSNQIVFGQYLNSGAYPTYSWGGSIDQVRIFNRALRPYEVEALYTEEYCTPTIVPSEHFNTVLYDGDGAATKQITGVGFQPDLVWIKGRTPATFNHVLSDSVRGSNAALYSNLTNAEMSPSDYGAVGTFDIDGFTTANGTGGSIEVNYNVNNQNYVAWNFKAGGDSDTYNVDGVGYSTAAAAGISTTGSNVTLQGASINTEAGFSVITFAGGSSYPKKVPHGLGVAPKLTISWTRNVANDPIVMTTVVNGTEDYLILNSTGTLITSTRSADSSIFDIIYSDNADYVSYCFAEVEGFSSFGSYVGTGASGNTVVTGFEPAFVMIKRTDAVDSWYMVDNKRLDNSLFADLSQAEVSVDQLDFVENGFVLKQSTGWGNSNGGSFIYMAFAADPTTVEPTLEDSFNTVIYSGTGTGVGVTNSITGVGFQPDLVWVKSRTSGSFWHNLANSVRGVNRRLFSNTTNAEDYDSSGTFNLLSFDNDGFTVGRDNNYNDLGTNNYVAWNWKGAELPAINSNGSIPSVVSANPAAGFSIVSYNSNGVAGSTIGHGLEAEPKNDYC